MADITANIVVTNPRPIFTDSRTFKAVANGRVYIGLPDTDPTIPTNQIPVYIENEDGSHVQISQPLIINASGKIVYGGQVVKVVTVQGHSMKVLDAYGAEVDYIANVLKYDPDRLRQELESPYGDTAIGSASYGDIRSYSGGSTRKIYCHGRDVPLDGASGYFFCDISDNTSLDDDGTVLIDALGRRWKREIVGYVYAEWWGAKPNNSTPSGDAFQKAIDYCSGKNRTSSSFGLKLKIRGGRWIIDKPLTYTWRDTDGIVDDGDMRRLTIEGDGQSNTYLIYTGTSSQPALYVKGHTGTPNDGVQLRFEMRGFRIWRSLSSPRVGVGLKTEHLAFMTMENVDIGYFNLNFQMLDTIQFVSRDCQIAAGNGGIDATIGDFSNPNVIKFDCCRFSGNQSYSVRVNRGANLIFDTCSFEGNGTSNTPGSGQYCIQYIGGPAEGGCGLSVNNTYFENNFVYSDISIENNTSISGTHSFTNNTFSRTDSTRFCNRHINLSSSSSGKSKIDLFGNAFKSFNSYAPSASFPVIVQQTSNFYVTDIGNYYANSIEKPNWNNFQVIEQSTNQMIGSGSVSSTGVLSNGWNISSVTKLGTGLYKINFARNPASGSSLIAIATAISSPCIAYLSSSDASSVTIATTNSSAGMIDASFSFVIYSNYIF
ncbi:phage tailspike protein [Cronobacter sakazakii]